jgi:CRISPR/Cas system-associated exonuclease Cas4 (RecB family)
MEHLFPKGEVLEGEQAIFGTAGMMCDLCDLLAEGGVTPLHPRILEVCLEDEERWREIAPLYRCYLDELKRHALWDPNEARMKALGLPAGRIRALVIACVPDLPEVARRRAAKLLEQGIPVTVLVWKPGTLGGGFDAWGRPVVGEWREADIPLSLDQIVMAKNPTEEAGRAIDFLAGAGGDHALVLGDKDLAPAFEAEIIRRGGSPFLPEGAPLARGEAAVVATEWITLRRQRDLRTLRRLIELPRFAAWVGGKSSLELLSETLSAEVIPAKGIQKKAVREAAATLQKILIKELSRESREIVAEAWKGHPEEAEEVLDLCEECSPVLKSWPDPGKAREASLVRSLAHRKRFQASREGDLDLSGWLEAPWAEARRLVLSGCVEGRLPSSIDGHPFLPDQKRRELGIANNAARRGRDAYLLSCLAHARPKHEFLCSFSKFGPDGSPSVPSSLLLRCPKEELPARVLTLFAKPESLSVMPRREHDWRWKLPRDRTTPVKINVTDFASYLSCPFRYYLKSRLDLRTRDPSQREMDALQFGTLLHAVLERYGRETPGLVEVGEITSVVFAHLEREVGERFGKDSSPAVRVQIEAARVRLLSFARIQAKQAAEGWKILKVEHKFGATEGEELFFGGMSISAMIDRIEMKGERVRVLDYKTQSSPKKPREVHLKAVSHAALPEAEVIVNGRPKAWVDLQLPLYRKIVEILHPGKIVEAGYFVLAADPEGSGVLPFELDEGMMESALTCAEAVALRIVRGVFWPPRQLPGNWEDPFGIFLEGGKPEECLDPASVALLKGRGGAS